jgi:predicted outer membrane repeat protein
MTHRRYALFLFIALFAIASMVIAPKPAKAAGTVINCTYLDLTTALTGGGVVDFNIGAPCTIVLGGAIAITANTTIQNTSNFNVTIDGNGTYRIFSLAMNISLSIDGMAGGGTGGITLTQGNGGGGGGGGAIRATAGGNIVTVEDVIFLNNGAISSGGGGAILSNGILSVTNSSFTGNSTNAAGGAIYAGGATTITNSTFTNNYATGNGGAVRTFVTATITGSTFITNNTGSSGGGIYIGGDVDIINTIFTDNTGSGTGQALTIDTATPVDVSGTTFTNNNCFIDVGSFNDLGGNIRDAASAACVGVVLTPLSATVMCSFGNLEINVSGDGNFSVTGTGPLLPANIPTGSNSIAGGAYGPGVWTGVTITETTGDLESMSFGDFSCNMNISTVGVCIGNDLYVGAVNGDANFDITGTGAGLPMLNNTGGTQVLTGPGSWTGVTITELSGDGQVVNLGDFNCVATNTLSASAVCVGADLQVTISNGDPNFQITADSGTLLTGLATGVHTITGPVNETNVVVTELAGDTENFPLGNFNCFASNTLTATATCNGANLDITITNGNSPFSISVTDSNGVMNLGSLPMGTYSFTGPDTFSNIGVTEDTGDLETLNLPSITCSAPIVPVVPVAPVVLSPDLTAQGCVFTTNIEAPNAPDNTYCRVLMTNGAVVNYAGAIPADLIGLGVKVAVDVYRLEGGATVNTFPTYQQICLAGEGRFFYMDGRNAPRYSVEMASEIVDGMTCAWIPAPGTVILTN